MYDHILALPAGNRRRQKRSRNIDLHIILDAGLQTSFHIDIIVIGFFQARYARGIGGSLGAFVLAGQQVHDLHHVFLEGFAAVGCRCVNMAHGNSAALTPHFHLLVILQVQVQFRIGIERKQRIIMRFRQAHNIHFRIRAVRIHACVQVDVMTAGQTAVHFHNVIAGNIIIHFGYEHAFQTAGIRFRRYIHFNLVAAAEGNVAAALIFAFLVQLRPFIHRDRICGCNSVIAVYPHVFPDAAAFAFYLVGNVYICIGVIHLASGRSHAGVFANVYAGLKIHRLCGCHIRRKLDHTADVHVVVPGFAVIGAGHNLVGRQHITLPCGQTGALQQIRPGIHFHLVV